MCASGGKCFWCFGRASLVGYYLGLGNLALILFLFGLPRYAWLYGLTRIRSRPNCLGPNNTPLSWPCLSTKNCFRLRHTSNSPLTKIKPGKTAAAAARKTSCGRHKMPCGRVNCVNTQGFVYSSRLSLFLPDVVAKVIQCDVKIY